MRSVARWLADMKETRQSRKDLSEHGLTPAEFEEWVLSVVAALRRGSTTIAELQDQWMNVTSTTNEPSAYPTPIGYAQPYPG